MKAQLLKKQQPIHNKPLSLEDVPKPKPAPDEILLRVQTCGLCRTDLHVIEGDLKPHKLPLIPGHQVVGTVEQVGKDVKGYKNGDRVGIAWLRHTCGVCEFCQNKQENLCPNSKYTGWDAHGGYAEYAVIPGDFAYHVPENINPDVAAPLLCAGIIGYRSLNRSELKPGQRLGIYGFGSSAHIVLQIAKYWNCEMFVITRGEKHQELAKKMGAAWVGGSEDKPPTKFNSAIIFAPAGELVPKALASLEKGGTLSLAGIYMSDIPTMNYEKYLFYEHSIRSVTSNTRQDGKELLELAQKIPIIPHIKTYKFEDANQGLIDLKEDKFQGSGVLIL